MCATDVFYSEVEKVVFLSFLCTLNLLRKRSRNTGFSEWLKLKNRPVFGSLKLKQFTQLIVRHDLRMIYARFMHDLLTHNCSYHGTLGCP